MQRYQTEAIRVLFHTLLYQTTDQVVKTVCGFVEYQEVQLGSIPNEKISLVQRKPDVLMAKR